MIFDQTQVTAKTKVIGNIADDDHDNNGPIKQIIESENPKKPYSDDKIAQILKKEEIHIARRTVAKYREMLKVLPSNKRKQL